MNHTEQVSLGPFNPVDPNNCAPAWQDYKREFLVHLDADGIDDKPGKRKVGKLLKCMGIDCIKIYDTFEWAPAIPAVAADEDHGIVARDAIPAEDKHNLDHVFKKFDHHWGVHRYRTIKRQEFLDTKRGEEQSIMDFIAELKRKAEHCDYGEKKEGFICDKVINGVKDTRCSERLLELSDDELTLNRVIEICRQTELTKAHMKTIASEEKTNKEVHQASRGRGHGGYRGRARGRGRGSSRGASRGSSRGRGNQRGGYRGHLPYCDWCCKHHEDKRCPAWNKYCDSCGEQGHFKVSPKCKNNNGYYRGRGSGYQRQRGSGRGGSRGRGGRQYSSQNVHQVVNDTYDRDNYFSEHVSEMFDDLHVNDVFVATVDNVKNSEWIATFDVGGDILPLEIDTGARCNVLSLGTLNSLKCKYQMKSSATVINGIHGVQGKSLGVVTLPCQYKGVIMNVQFEVLDGAKKLDLLGRYDSVRFGLIARVHNVSVNCSCEHILSEFKDVVGDSIGCMPGEYAIKVDHSVEPVVHPPRPVPAPIRDKVKNELDALERKNIIAKVSTPTAWVNSMVVVGKKKTDRVRICIDPTDLNKAIRREHFPMNSIDDVATRLTGSKVFSVLDANMGYFQIKLDEKSSELTTFNTPFGRYRYLRMPMGITCASEVFQREMVHQFGEMEGVEIVVDDILVHGRSYEEHNKRLTNVLKKAREINLKLNRKKCKIGVNEVDYVGHKLTTDGLKPTDERVRAIQELPEPTNIHELETVLGMVAYVSKFIPRLSELNAPLRELKMKENWMWGATERNALAKIKSALTSAPVLKYYDATKPVKLSVDASVKGLGAAVIQENGVVAYASRAMTPTEQRYAQIEKEMLAVVFGCTKFHKLIYGKSDVIIESDHKPLESLLKKPMHISPMRIQRMRLKLQPYSFELVHTSGKSIGLADCLSRFPRKMTKEDTVMDDDLMVCVAETVVHKPDIH